MWMLTASALGGALYINGTYVEPKVLAGRTLENTSIHFDAQGNVLIDAPGYKIEVVGAPEPPKPPPVAPKIAYGRWWLVSEDKGSAGHTVEVWINGTIALTLRSGDGGKLVEISRWLKLGENTVVVKSSSANAGGGIFAVYLGAGGSESGSFDMPSPAVSFEIGASRSGPYQREYTLTVDR